MDLMVLVVIRAFVIFGSGVFGVFVGFSSFESLVIEVYEV